MSELKKCPFCLEEIPIKAIKCRYCESTVNDVPPSPVKKSQPSDSMANNIKAKQAPPSQGYYQPATEKKSKRILIPIIILVFLFLIGAGFVYWFLYYDNGAPVAETVDDADIVGSWKGTSGDIDIYFQFLPNDMVNVAVPPEGYWFRTQYRLVRAETGSYLELYHRGLTEWERTAQLDFSDDEKIIMTDTWANIRIELERIADSEFRDAINDLRFER